MKYEIRTLADIFNKVPVDKIELCMAEIAAAMVMGKGTLGMMEIIGQWPDVVEWIDDGAGNVGAEIVIGDDVLEIESRKIPFFSEKSRIAELEAENQALRADAERYRFVRVKACIIGGEFQILNMPNAGDEWRQKYDAAEQLDAAIDAERGMNRG